MHIYVFLVQFYRKEIYNLSSNGTRSLHSCLFEEWHISRITHSSVIRNVHMTHIILLWHAIRLTHRWPLFVRWNACHYLYIYTSSKWMGRNQNLILFFVDMLYLEILVSKKLENLQIQHEGYNSKENYYKCVSSNYNVKYLIVIN